MLTENKSVRRYNRASEVSYEVKLLSWESGSYRLELQGRFRGFKTKLPTVHAPRNKTALLFARRGKDRVLTIALTPLAAINPLYSGSENNRTGVENPKLLYRKTPSYPDRLTFSRFEGAVIVRSIVTTGGLLDLSRVLLLECAHGLFARETLEALRSWKFSPGIRNGQPVAVVVTVEAKFNVH